MELIIKCPHCEQPIIIEQINCGIFRHGIYKTDCTQIDPHSSKEICDELVRKNIIYGCGKPFRITNIDGQFISTKCEYI